MDISINGKGLDIGDALRGHVGNALTNIVGKYFPKAYDAVVTVSREAHLFRADVTVHPTRGFIVQGRAAADDAYAAVDAAVERIAKQLRRYKRRINDHHGRRPAEEGMPAQQYIIAAESDEEELPAEGQPPIIAEIATEMADKIEIVKLNIDENPETAMAYRVMSVPTLTIFKGGQPVQSVAGARPKGDLVRFIESAI